MYCPFFNYSCTSIQKSRNLPRNRNCSTDCMCKLTITDVGSIHTSDSSATNYCVNISVAQLLRTVQPSFTPSNSVTVTITNVTNGQNVPIKKIKGAAHQCYRDGDGVGRCEQIITNRRCESTSGDTHLACSTSARTPAASGAEAEVPVCFVVHVAFRSVVVYKNRNHHQNI